MTDRRDPAPSIRQLDETLREGGERGPDELARELFVHGLLVQKAELERSGAEFRSEARIRSILDRLRAPTRGPGTVIAPPRRAVKLLSAAATFLVALALWYVWPKQSTPAFADELLERAAHSAANGIHVYEVSLYRKYERRRRHWHRHRRNKDRPRSKKTYVYQSKWLAALGPNRTWNVRKLSGNWPFVDGTELGSDGKTIWIKARNGYAFDLFLDPKGIQLTELEPVMSYYQLRSFLETVLKELDVELKERRNGRVRLAGSYSYERERSWRKLRRDPKHWVRNSFLGDTGAIELVLDEASGALVELSLRQSSPDESTMRVVRQETPADLGSAGFEFDPKRTRVSPDIKLWSWMGVVIKAWRRGTRSEAKEDKRRK